MSQQHRLLPYDIATTEGAGGRLRAGWGMLSRHLWRALLIGIGTLGAATAGWWMLGPRAIVQYTTSTVERGDVTRTVTATGTVNPELTIIVGTYVSGVIQDLYCDYNTQVKKGQVCAKIDPRPYQSQVDQAKANLAIAKAQLEKDKAYHAYTKVAFDRAARLVQTKTISQDTFDNAKSTLEQAEAQIAYDDATIQQRQAALDAAQVNLDYTDIGSPVDGTVVSRNVTRGQTVAASFQTPTLFLIATDLTKMEVDANVSESDIGGISAGQKATFTVDAFPKRTFEGTVSQVRQSPQTVQNVVTYDVVVSVDNSDLVLKPGMTAATRIVIDHRPDVLRVPNQALRYAPSSSSGARAGPAIASRETRIWLLRNDKPMPVTVVIGLDDDSFAEIASGAVEPGDLVITGERPADSRGGVVPRLRF
ncbi:MAG TPA: efflux RND transporter periplasmic adaptor subunit [Hyphomicrobiaceae bacterium]|jgi:HlyD family secretion protein